MLEIGTHIRSTWSDRVSGIIVGYGDLMMPGEDPYQVYLVDIGYNRMFDLDREQPGPTAARILSLRFDRVEAV